MKPKSKRKVLQSNLEEYIMLQDPRDFDNRVAQPGSLNIVFRITKPYKKNVLSFISQASQSYNKK